MISQVNISSLALPLPINLGNLCVPPNPGIIPSPTSGCPNFAFSAAILISQAIDSSHPPPSANPFTAAILTCGISSNFEKASFANNPIVLPSEALAFTISDMSAPATKDFSPEPVSITTFISFLFAISEKV